MDAYAVWQVFIAPLRRRAGRSLLALLAIALGVALASAVAIIHRSAQADFAESLRALSGGADLQVVAGRDEVPLDVYYRLAADPRLAWAVPVLLRDLRLAEGDEPLPLMGVDALALPGPASAAGVPIQGVGAASNGGLLQPDTVLLSRAAAQSLGRGEGDVLTVLTERGPHRLTVIGLLPTGLDERRLAVADIAVAHALFGSPGRVTRIDLRLAVRGPAEQAAAVARLAATLPPGVALRTPEHELELAEGLSRAYRVNLSMLALMALLTGAFLVFAVQAASLLRRRQEIALLRALGMSRRQLTRGLLVEAGLIGLLGSLIGSGLGLLVAAAVLRWRGGDLGAGYFSGVAPSLAIGPGEWLPYVLLGVGAALAGAWWPTRAAVRADPARALRAGDAEAALTGLDTLWPAAACALAGTGLLALPAVDGIPWGGYLAIGLWLTAAVLALPGISRRLWWRLPLPRRLPAVLALAQLRGAARLVAIGAGGVLAATAVAAAMAIMVQSFRTSVDRWLGDMLVADLYVRLGRAASGLGFDAEAQQRLLADPAVAEAVFVRYRSVLLDPRRPAVTLIARPLAVPPPAVTPAHAAPPGLPAVWISEALVDLYGWRAGRTVVLPISGREQPVFIAGVWRDYVRSHGALIVDLAAYRALSGDQRADEVGLRLRAGSDHEALIHRLRRALVAGPWLEIERRDGLRQRSLELFDRSFAATYALELAALVIGLAGVAASFAAQAAGRLREFGMLRYLGVSRASLQVMVALEAAAVAGLGIVLGLGLAFAIGWVLIEVVNRQSFHWSMDLVVPWGALAGLAAAMLLAALTAALVATRNALGAAAVRAVREDW